MDHAVTLEKSKMLTDAYRADLQLIAQLKRSHLAIPAKELEDALAS
jgi:hypothetical protein